MDFLKYLCRLYIRGGPLQIIPESFATMIARPDIWNYTRRTSLPHLATAAGADAHVRAGREPQNHIYTCTFSALGLRLDDFNVFEIFGWLKRAIGVGHDPPLRIP